MSGNQELFQKLMNNGHSAVWDQDWQRAAEYYRHAVEEIPNHPLALSSLGLALMELNDLAGALECYQRAARAAPSDPGPVDKIARIHERNGQTAEFIRALLQAAELYLKNRDVDKAIQNWLQVLRVQPANLAAHSRLAVVYEHTGKGREAVTEYLAIASILQRTGEAPRALQAIQRAMQVMPNSEEAAQALALLRANQPLPAPSRPRITGRLGRSSQPKSEALPAPAEDTGQDPIAEARQHAMVELAALLFEQSETAQDTRQVSRRGLTTLTRGTGGLGQNRMDQSRLQLHLGQAIDSQTQGQDQQAAAELERVLDIGLTQPPVYFDLGLLLAGSDPAKALRHLSESVKHPDYDLASCLLMGQIHQKQEHWAEAAVAYIQALKLADLETVPADQREELEQLYEAYLINQSEMEEATLQEYCRTIAPQLLRNDWRSFLRTARQQATAGQLANAVIPLAEVLLESRNSQVVESMAIIRQLMAVDKVSSAMEEAFHALQYAPTYLPLHILIGEMLLKEGRNHEAVEKFMLVAQLYSLRGEATQAIRLLTRVTQMTPMDLSIRGRLIELLMSQDRMDEAIQQYLDLAGIYYSLAELDMARKTYQSALRLAQRSTDPHHWTWELLNRIADIDMQRLDWRGAFRVFEQMRTLDPNHSLPRRQLIAINLRLSQDAAAIGELDAYIALLENAGKRTEAIQFTRELVAEEPKRTDIRKRLADLFVRNGERLNAVRELDTLADALLNAGDHLGAIAMVQAIVSLNPPNVADYETALEQLRGK